MDINTLIQNVSQIIAYILEIIKSVEDNEISVKDVSIDSLSVLITSKVKSSAVSFDPNTAFYNEINGTLNILSYSAGINDTALSLSCLDLLIYQLTGFLNMEAGWTDKFANNYSAYCLKQFQTNYLSTHQPSFSGRKVVYTAITGGYDNLMEPAFVNPDFDYICFSDNPELTSETWTIIPIDNSENLDNTRLARKYKLLPHEFLPEYDLSVWIDGKFEMTGDMEELVNIYLQDSDMLCFPHYKRDCIFDEAEVCCELSRGNSEEIERQVDKYKKESVPAHMGLVETGVLIRRHNSSNVIKLMNDWWNEVLHESTRDQISFPYVCMKNNFTYNLCPYYIEDNPYCVKHSHIK